MSEAVLEARELALDYGSRRVLVDVNLRVANGEIVALLGASGAGKSTLLRALAGLLPMASGTLTVFGQPAKGVQQGVALAFQDPCLLPWRNVEANVAFGLDFANQPRRTRRERKQCALAALAQVELSHAAHYHPSQLSGGMAQRVALARCLAHAPRVLLLDEPFAALDEVTRLALGRLLSKLVRELDTALVLVTHDIDEALMLADRVVLLGGSPATIERTFDLRSFHPRERHLEDVSRVRLDIFQRLREATTRSVEASAAAAQ